MPTPPVVMPRILTMMAIPPSRAPNCIGRKKSKLPISEEKANIKRASAKPIGRPKAWRMNKNSKELTTRARYSQARLLQKARGCSPRR